MLPPKPKPQPLIDMKRLCLPTPILLLAISAVLVASARDLKARENNASTGSGAIFATTAADGGRLFIKRSPVLGANVAIAVRIDGKPAGTLMRGHTYDRYITPGRHVVTLSPNRLIDPWHTTLDVRAGETYSYIASYNGGKLVLTPTKPR